MASLVSISQVVPDSPGSLSLIVCVVGALAVLALACRKQREPKRRRDERRPVRKLACPACGSGIVLMDRADAPMVRCYCYPCDFVGPFGLSDSEATGLWNAGALSERVTMAEARGLLQLGLEN